MKHIYLLIVTCLNVMISLAQAGTLDSSFSGDGFFRANDQWFTRGAIQADKKFVLAGSGFPYHYQDLEVYRYTPEGLPDATFGSNGTARVTIGGNTALREVLVQKDGKVLVLGESRVAWPAGNGVIASTALARFMADGKIDETFGEHGIIKFVFGNAASVYAGEFSMTLQHDGKILVCGPDYTISDNTFSLWRFNTSGSRDNGFGSNGKVIKSIGTHAFSNRVVVQSDGKIIHLGATTDYDRFVARYLINGHPDLTFNGTGTYFDNGGGRYVDAVIQPDGKVLAAVDRGNSFNMERMNANGTPDKNFGVNGVVETHVSLPLYTNSIDLQDNGKIILGGSYAPNPGAYGYGIALARYLPTGVLDNSFGTSGVVMKYLGYNTGGTVIGVTDKRIYVLGSGAETSPKYMNYGVVAAFKNTEPAPPSSAVNVNVPGTSNLWLAGMPNGTPSLYGDVAPANSPVRVNINLNAGTWIEASNVMGGVSHGLYPLVGPDGCHNETECAFPYFIISHDAGAEYSKSNLTAPINSLIGVFLDNNTPAGAAPFAFDFSSASSRDYSELHPQLKQTFFIGDGKTSSGGQQKIFIPANATRLYLGTMDGTEWNNNNGSFNATISVMGKEQPEGCGMNKVRICHKGKTICISSNAVAAHLRHGDKLGSCNGSTPGKPKGHKGDQSVLDEQLAGQFTVSNSPNPFHNTTNLQYEIPADGHVMVKVYNVLGREVATLVNARQSQGTYTTSFGGSEIAGGVYYYHVIFTNIQQEVFTKVGKMVLVR